MTCAASPRCAPCCTSSPRSSAPPSARSRQAGRTIGIKIRLDDFSTHTRARSLSDATNDFEVVHRVAAQLLEEFDPRRPVRLLGVRVAGLDESSSRENQLELAL